MVQALSSQRFLFSGPVDAALFGGSAAFSVLTLLVGRAFGVVGDAPLWAWLVFVLGIDVAHVWATLYRVYFDGEELERRPVLAAGAPLLALTLGVATHLISPALFWTCLAYAAVWHFIRQQTGWMVLYGRRAADDERTIRWDVAAIGATTVAPIIWWHANLPRPFWWFRENDFVGSLPRWCGFAALGLHGVVVVAWLFTTLRGARTQGLPSGKLLLFAATWTTWMGGIVLAADDFAFTVMNVTLHGVPYLGLLWRYAQGRVQAGGAVVIRRILRGGLVAFLGVLWVLAFGEELLWDNLVWHDHASVFGDWGLVMNDSWLTLVVPLLSLPQVTHYILDGFIWKTRNNPQLSTHLGFTSAVQRHAPNP